MTPAVPSRLSFAAAWVLALSLEAAAATPAAPAAVSTVAFDTTPRAGQHQRQRIDIKAVVSMRAQPGPNATDEQRARTAQAAEKFAQMGAMKMAVKMDQTLKVGQPDAEGWLPLTVSTGSQAGQVEVGGKTQPLPQGKELGFIARFNPKDFAFEIQDVEGAAEVGDVVRNQGRAIVGEALQLYKVLAQRPLKVGESVEVPMNLALPMPLPGGAGAMQAKLRYTLTRLDKGVAHFDTAMNMQMDINAPTPAASAASQPADDTPPQLMNVAMNGSGKGSSTLRLADGLPLTSQLRMVMTITMQMPDNGLMLMDMDMDTRARGESLAKAAAQPAKKKN